MIRVLFVDDEPALVSLAECTLARRGFDVFAYACPRTALETFRAAPGNFDVLVTDFRMPGMSGFDLLRHFLAIRKELPVVVVTGLASDGDRADILAAGAREVVPKGETLDHFVEAIHRAAGSAGA